ncbi:MAG: AAA family ATPase [Candidatus Marinimicrobia bacterium]|nr:AAA family ATPase [Candidatus Neomarinimicrobiota bacterium]
MTVIPRHVTESIIDTFVDTPVVLLNSARQTGKSTLVQWLASNEHPARYLTLDNPVVLAATKEDPEGFLARLKGPIILDKIQKVQELFLAIKAEVDRERQPCRSMLYGNGKKTEQLYKSPKQYGGLK